MSKSAPLRRARDLLFACGMTKLTHRTRVDATQLKAASNQKIEEALREAKGRDGKLSKAELRELPEFMRDLAREKPKADVTAESQALISRYLDYTAQGRPSINWGDVTMWAASSAFQIMGNAFYEIVEARDGQQASPTKRDTQAP